MQTKVFNLYKGLPIGAITWGSGSIGPHSIGLLAKDFRECLTKELNPKSYSIKQASQLLNEFMFDKHYKEHFKDYKPDLGFLIAGYSAAANLPEVYVLETGYSSSPKPEPQELSLVAKGMPDAVNRLVFGFSINIIPTLLDLGLTEGQLDELLPELFRRLSRPLVTQSMPLQDAIELAEFLVDTTIKYQRFSFDDKMVGGPIEIAAISKYEGFKWIKRKHYYSQELNPEDIYERIKKISFIHTSHTYKEKKEVVLNYRRK